MRKKGEYKLNEGQFTYLKDNMDTMPRRELARRLGVSESTIYYHIKRLGGEVKTYCSLKSDVTRIVIEHYPHMTPGELVERFGHARGTYIHYASELGIKRTPECEKRIYEERKQRVLKANPYLKDPEGFKKKMQMLRRMEEMRESSGQPRKTKLRLRKFPIKVTKARWRLLQKKNYIEIIGEPYNFAYDDDTERVREDIYAERYGFRFFDIDDIEVEDD